MLPAFLTHFGYRQHIRDIACASLHNIHLVSRYPRQMLPSRDSDFATSVRSLFRDWLMLIANELGLEYFVPARRAWPCQPDLLLQFTDLRF